MAYVLKENPKIHKHVNTDLNFKYDRCKTDNEKNNIRDITNR